MFRQTKQSPSYCLHVRAVGSLLLLLSLHAESVMGGEVWVSFWEECGESCFLVTQLLKSRGLSLSLVLHLTFFFFHTPLINRNTVTSTSLLKVYIHPVPCTILRVQICIWQDKTYFFLIISWWLYYDVLSLSLFPSGEVEYLTYHNMAKDTLKKKNKTKPAASQWYGVVWGTSPVCFEHFFC